MRDGRARPQRGSHRRDVLSLWGTTLTNNGRHALVLERADIKGHAALQRLDVNGEVWAVGVTIGGQLKLEGANLSNEGRTALSLDRADIKGGAFLRGVKVTGEIRALSHTHTTPLPAWLMVMVRSHKLLGITRSAQCEHHDQRRTHLNRRGIQTRVPGFSCGLL